MSEYPTLRKVEEENAAPEEIVKRVGLEVLERNFEPATWAKALSSASGGFEEAVIQYTRLRIAQLTRTHYSRSQRRVETEFRRLNTCLGIRSVSELLERMYRGHRPNSPRLRFPLVWTLLMIIGFAGSIGAGCKLFAGHMPATILQGLPAIAIGSSVFLACGLVLGSIFMPKSFHKWFWNEGVIGASAAICLLSAMLGAKVMLTYPYQPDKKMAAAVEQMPDVQPEQEAPEIVVKEVETRALLVSVPEK